MAYMSVSLYYAARRRYQITSMELSACNKIIKQYNAKYPFGELYEHFGIDDLTKYSYIDEDKNTIILSGSTKLPPDIFDVDFLHDIINWWLKCLNEMTKVLPDAQWNVHIDDITIL